MFSTILIIVLLFIIWFLLGAAYMLLDVFSGSGRRQRNKMIAAFFAFPVDLVMNITKRLTKR